MIKRILVALDGSALSEQTLPFAERVARGGEGELILCRVVPPASTVGVLVRSSPDLLPFMVSLPVERPEFDAQTARNEHYEAEHYLDAQVDRLGQLGVVAHAALAVGDAAPTLIDEARLRGCDLIAVGTHGRSTVGGMIFGSVAEAVVAQSPLPVYLARSWTPKTVEHWSAPDLSTDAPIMVPLDGTARAEAALHLAAELSLQLGTSVHLLQVVASNEPAAAEVEWGEDLPRRAINSQEIAARSYLTELVRRLRAQGIRATASVEVDDVGPALEREARARRASLVVMATHASTGLSRILVHSVARDVLHRLPLPIILLGPNSVDASMAEELAG